MKRRSFEKFQAYVQLRQKIPPNRQLAEGRRTADSRTAPAPVRFRQRPPRWAGEFWTPGEGPSVEPPAARFARTLLQRSSNPSQTLSGSFSAASSPIFAERYSLVSISQVLRDLHPFALLWTPILAEVRQTTLHFLEHFSKIAPDLCEFRRFSYGSDSDESFLGFHRGS